jgi:hypothetical protein
MSDMYITTYKGDIGCIHLPRNRWHDISLGEPDAFITTPASQLDYLIAFMRPYCIAFR